MSYKSLGLFLKIHILDSHLDFLPAYVDAVSDEQGKSFHQDIILMEKRYRIKWSAEMLAGYWRHKRDFQEAKY